MEIKKASNPNNDNIIPIFIHIYIKKKLFFVKWLIRMQSKREITTTKEKKNKKKEEKKEKKYLFHLIKCFEIKLSSTK